MKFEHNITNQHLSTSCISSNQKSVWMNEDISPLKWHSTHPSRSKVSPSKLENTWPSTLYMRGAEALLPIQGSGCPSSDGKAELTGTYQNFESEIYGYSDGYNRDRLGGQTLVVWHDKVAILGFHRSESFQAAEHTRNLVGEITICIYYGNSPN